MAQGQSYTLVIEDHSFPSLRAAAEHLGLSRKTLEKWVAQAEEGETPSMSVMRHLEKKRCIVDGVLYASQAAAGKALGMSSSEVGRKLRNRPSIAVTLPRKRDPVVRVRVSRPQQADWSRSVAEVVKEYPALKDKLANLDVDQATRVPGRGAAPAKLHGVHCRHHGALDPFRVQDLRVPRQPCRACRTASRATAPRAPGRARTIMRLEASWGRDDLDLSGAVLESAHRGEKLVHGIVCRRCDNTLEPVYYGHAIKGHATCQTCPAGRYDEADVRAMVETAHCGAVAMLAFEGRIHGSSRFACAACAHEWTTSVSAVIGSKSNRPTGCPVCIRTTSRAEEVAHALTARGIAFDREWRLPGSASRMAFDFHLVACRLVIEFDGDHHYGPSMRHKDAAVAQREYDGVRDRDRRKRDEALRQGIRVCRIPFFVDDIDAEVDAILAGTPRWPDLPDPEHYPDRLNAVRGRAA